MDRRLFLRQAALGIGAASGALSLARPLFAASIARDPYALPPLPRGRFVTAGAPPVRVTGRVTGGGRPLANVAVSDGLTVVQTDRDGRYTLLARPELRFVRVTVPSGYRLPMAANASGGCFRPLPLDGRAEASMLFELEPLAASDTRHAFLLLADPQTQTREETDRLHAESVPAMQAAVRALGDRETFAVGCGDLMFDDLSLFPEWERAATRVGVPMINVVGNHDLDMKDGPTNGLATRTFESHFGPTWHSFDRGEIHYVVLDDVFWYGDGYMGYLDDLQAAWLAADLALVEKGRTVVVLTHIPVVSTFEARLGIDAGIRNSMQNRQLLYRLLDGYNAWILSGHTHEQERSTDGGVQHVVHGAVCGAWWSGPICHDGTPNGFAVYEVNGSQIQSRYQGNSTEPLDQLRAYARGADLSAPEEIVANVWDARPDWTVTWWEGSDRRGQMARRRGRDPLSVQLHLGPALPTRRTWVEPIPTDHLFYAPVPTAVTELRIEVTTADGKTFSAPVPRPA